MFKLTDALFLHNFSSAYKDCSLQISKFYHKGFFAFRLCPNNNPKKAPLEECFTHYPLKFANGEEIYMVERLVQGSGGIFLGERIELEIKLPDGLECWQCILQKFNNFTMYQIR